MKARKRTDQEHAACGLPTRTLRIRKGRDVLELEIGSGQFFWPAEVLDIGIDDLMAGLERIVKERAAVRQV